MCFRFMYAIEIVISIAIVARLAEANQHPPPCCGQQNILKDRSCNYNGLKGQILLDCENGKYLLDPSDNKLDTYHILENGYLQMNSSSPPVPIDAYCITNYLGNGSNETREVALVCFGQHVKTAPIMFMVKGTMALISVFFLLLTLYVYWIIPDLRETQDKVTCVTLICLMIFMLVLGIIQIAEPEKLTQSFVCQPFAYIIYYFSVAYFTWLNLIMLNVWKNSVIPKWNIVEKHWYRLNHVYGWCVPTILTITVYITSILEGGYDPGFGEKSCWFEEKQETWTFLYAPISIMLIINIILFAWSAYGIHSHGNDVSPDKRRALIYKFTLYFKLFILAGFTWIFEVLSYHFQKDFDISYWFITDILNALHGVLIFCVLVVWRRRVRKELANRRIFCLRTPASWAENRDPEEEQLNDETKHHLTHK
ncbi:G-protein coupled receptor Mth2-like [Bradysia coprophila]|uniref:G-protein coupled receptor Mth2-like n=1 Tax=Bradysia coprophila TaxID=38358 RepID=UPI00187D97A3|nr:G-protein coupled receptor Mth2-like [Bradysia coprophila]XP_037029891.1 G-protein coupled receptor Mth2-like [Bradysia coprophila]XP_037029892.1 G-protein coupled receptor Mth2-like [Bradysia coprophila]XP_037029893.1 G-protein coupled receptor Mth2-like [Bradysia coprophila]